MTYIFIAVALTVLIGLIIRKKVIDDNNARKIEEERAAVEKELIGLAQEYGRDDRVIVTNPFNLFYGERGCVVGIDGFLVAVSIDGNRGGHNCDGILTDKSGWYFNPRDIALLIEAEDLEAPKVALPKKAAKKKVAKKKVVKKRK